MKFLSSCKHAFTANEARLNSQTIVFMESVRVRTRPCLCAADESAQIETHNPGEAKKKNMDIFFPLEV